LATNSWISKIHIQISKLYVSVVPGPVSQDTVFKLVFASPALQCKYEPTEILPPNLQKDGISRANIQKFSSIKGTHARDFHSLF
jgi:hypothetical protein